MGEVTEVRGLWVFVVIGGDLEDELEMGLVRSDGHPMGPAPIWTGFANEQKLVRVIPTEKEYPCRKKPPVHA
jgi:hypothetical protein